MSARACGTCTRPVYPKEKVAISDIWLHSACLKCSVCSSTLSLNSVYVSVASGEKKIYCKVDVPRAIHTAVVDSIALRRALTAPKADNPGPKALKTGTGSMRFKGLTLRSKGMRGGMDAPKLGVKAGTGQVVVGMVKGSTLDSWDIAHAMEVQSFASSPLNSHPAIQAQRTGGNSFMSPSILHSQHTGSTHTQTPSNGTGADADDEREDDGIAREKKGEKEQMPMEKNLVKNLLRTFQLSSLEVVALPAPSTPTPSSSPTNPTTTGPGTFSTLKLSQSLLTDLTPIATLGTRSNRVPTAKPSLQSLFTDPAAGPPVVDTPKKQARFSEKVPSIIAAFAPGEMVGAEGDEGEDADVEWDGEGEDGGMGDEEMMRRMEEVGLEVVMVYEEEPKAEVAKAE